VSRSARFDSTKSRTALSRDTVGAAGREERLAGKKRVVEVTVTAEQRHGEPGCKGVDEKPAFDAALLRLTSDPFRGVVDFRGHPPATGRAVGCARSPAVVHIARKRLRGAAEADVDGVDRMILAPVRLGAAPQKRYVAWGNTGRGPSRPQCKVHRAPGVAISDNKVVADRRHGDVGLVVAVTLQATPSYLRRRSVR
jgi:hypothetical protein